MRLLQCLQCLALMLAASGAAAALYHELSMAALAPPETLPPDAFFGYSLAYDSESKRLVSSAPRADRLGRVYSCDLSKKDCRQLHVVDPKKIPDTSDLPHHHFWLGATVKADASRGNLMVCAPRYMDTKMMSNGYKHFATYGKCYHKNLSELFEVLPDMPLEVRQRTAVRNEDLTDSFGWSIDIADDGHVRIGGPAMLNGRVMTFDMNNLTVAPSILTGNDSNPKINYNFGYRIASGNFLSPSPSFAVSSTYGDIGEGKVVIFEDNVARQSVSGEVGTMFGASLCAARFLPARSALLVGAPAHFADQERYHTGIVYVYANNENELKLSKKIEGPMDGGLFGYAIVNVGDMDMDGKDEVAIAAPYEGDGAGAVYVFAGAALAATAPARWLQRLQPRGFRSFGLSLTAFSFSDNGCNDLGVGAPGNDKVAVYHCLPIVNVNVKLITPDMKTRRTDKTGFEIKYCLYTGLPKKPEIIKAEFEVTVKITHASAYLADNPSSNDIKYRELVERNKSSPCRRIVIKTDKDGDYELPIRFDVEAKLLNDPLQIRDYDPSKATLSPQSSLSDTDSVLAAECRTDFCKPKLRVEVLTSFGDTYVTGSTETERLSIIVHNGDGDSAYRPRARIVVYAQDGAEIAAAPPTCAWAGLPRQRNCTLAGGLRGNHTWNLTEAGPVVLDMSKITSASASLSLRVEVSNSRDTHPADLWEKRVTLTHDASGVRLLGKSDQGEAVNVTTMNLQTGKKLQHTYTIINTHGTNWKGLVCKILLKKEAYALFEFPIKIYSQSSTVAPPAPCQPSARAGTDEAYSLECPIGDLFRKDTITIVIPVYIIPGKLKIIYDTLNVTLRSSVTLNFGKKAEEIGTVVTTTLMLQQAYVPLWMILCAAAVGFVLVLLLAFAMYECGCLRRKNKEMLENLKKEVNRKSMILQRRSMRLSNSERASLRNKTYRELLDEAEAKEAEEATTDQPVPFDEPNKTEIDQLDKNNKKSHKNISDTSDQSSEPDEPISNTSMSDKRILVEKSLKLQRMKNGNC